MEGRYTTGGPGRRFIRKIEVHDLFHTYHNFVLPHASLRLPLSDAIHGTGSGKRWQQRTPAMAAGLTDRVWNLREVLMYRVPPWPQPQGG
jgi:hypothetical protein